MTIGDLKHRITFQKLITLVNENGFEIEEWQNYKTVWAEASDLYGREYYQATKVKVNKTIKFLVRYLNGIDTSMRIKFKDKEYNITSIDNMKYENKYVEIKALEIENNG